LVTSTSKSKQHFLILFPITVAPLGLARRSQVCLLPKGCPEGARPTKNELTNSIREIIWLQKFPDNKASMADIMVTSRLFVANLLLSKSWPGYSISNIPFDKF
jgi:hypothetical protein